MEAKVLRARGAVVPLSTTLVMGVVNASPESFSDAGSFRTLEARFEHAARQIEEGADIIDVGGQSAITGQPEIDPVEEIDRVAPLVEWIRQQAPHVIVSVDTYKPAVVQAVLTAGAHVINDVSGLRHPQVAQLCAEQGAALVVMHTAAPPKVRLQDRDQYDNVSQDVERFLVAKTEEAISLGVNPESIIVDPGPDFTKTPHQTIEVLRGIDGVRRLGFPLLLAISRKDFLGAITGRSPKNRGPATAAAVAHFARWPGAIVRVHDVAAAKDVIATVETLEGLRDIDPAYLLPDSIRHEPVV